jgi:FtsZ-binding cell division protein ZapB
MVIVTSLLHCKFKDEPDDEKQEVAEVVDLADIPKMSALPVLTEVPALPQGQSGTPEVRLEALEKAIDARVELLADAAVGGVAALVAQVGAYQKTVEMLKQEVEMELAQDPSVVPPETIQAIQNEIQALRAANADLEAETRGNEAKIQQIRGRMRGAAQAAQGRTRTLIRRMMDDVYHDTAALFQERKLYGGGEVSEGLKKTLKRHSLTAFDDIKQNGLF